jgi:hypothetical protein
VGISLGEIQSYPKIIRMRKFKKVESSNPNPNPNPNPLFCLISAVVANTVLAEIVS